MQISELALHKARGFTTIQEYAEKTLGLAEYATFQYMRVADAFSADMAALFGPEKLDWLLRYASLTPEDEDLDQVPTTKIRIPARGDQPAQEKPFEQTTLAELRAAVAGARTGAGRREKASASMPEEVVESLQKAEKPSTRRWGRNTRRPPSSVPATAKSSSRCAVSPKSARPSRFGRWQPLGADPRSTLVDQSRPPPSHSGARAITPKAPGARGQWRRTARRQPRRPGRIRPRSPSLPLRGVALPARG
ncbi:MAG: hypothetical protein HY698_01520 [Deltaproteobacteria bacterium]|nr:hypothetical protein [Deltaproteobacteria bacterium]